MLQDLRYGFFSFFFFFPSFFGASFLRTEILVLPWESRYLDWKFVKTLSPSVFPLSTAEIMTSHD
jgi:hypothetical protein